MRPRNKTKPGHSGGTLFQDSLLALFVIFLAGFFLYAHILDSPAQFDDESILFTNPLIKDLPSFLDKWQTDNTQKALTFLTFAVNYHFSGERTFSYHCVNVLLHIMTAGFLYYLVRLLLAAPVLSSSLFARERSSFALFTALIFVVHPLQTQAVTYIWQRSEVLSGFFYLAAFLCYLAGRIRNRKGLIILAAVLTVVGFFAKGLIVTLPLLVFLTEVSFFQPERFVKFYRKNWPLLLVLGLLVLINIRLSSKFYTFGLATPEYLMTQSRVLWKYIGLAFFPISQNLDYDIRLSRSLLDPVTTIFSLLGLTGLVVLVVRLFKQQRLIVFGILWFFIYLIPTSLIIREPMWEHRLYISLAGFAVSLVAAVFVLVPNAKTRNNLLTMIIILLSILTLARNNLWRSPVRLMEDTVKKSPRKARPHLILGVNYLKEKQLEKAWEELLLAMALDPVYAGMYFHNNIGLIYLEQDQVENAISHFEKAIAAKKNYSEPYINLADIYLYRQRNYAKAESLFKESLSFRESFHAYFGLGMLYFEIRDLDKAIFYLEKARRLDRNNSNVYYRLGNACYFKQDYPQAVAMYKKAVLLNPSLGEAHYNLGMIYAERREFDTADFYLEKAFGLLVNRPDLCKSLARVYKNLNEPLKAAELEEKCLRLTGPR